VVSRCDPHSIGTLTARSYLAISSALRRRCGLRPGDMVLLAALPEQERSRPTRSQSWTVLRAHAPFPGIEGAGS
jgi:hypothetical protein